MSTFKKDLKLFLGLLFIFLSFYVLYLVAYYDGRLSGDVYNAKISQLSICAGPDPVTNMPLRPMSTIQEGYDETIYACGHLSFDFGLKLRAYWYDDEDDYPGSFYSSPPGVKIQPGYFYIPLEYASLSPGKYSLNIALGRYTYATSKFEVVDVISK